MKKHFALLVSAFVLALCSYADAWANTHVVAPQKGNSIQSVVVPAQDLASVTFFEFNPVLETWSALSVTSNVPGQEAITSVVVLTADKTPAWNTIQSLGATTSVAVFHSEIIAATAWQHDSLGLTAFGPAPNAAQWQNHRTSLVESTFCGVALAQPHFAWWKPAADCPVGQNIRVVPKSGAA